MWKGLQEKQRAYEFYRAAIDLGLPQEILWCGAWGMENASGLIDEDCEVSESLNYI